MQCRKGAAMARGAGVRQCRFNRFASVMQESWPPLRTLLVETPATSCTSWFLHAFDLADDRCVIDRPIRSLASTISLVFLPCAVCCIAAVDTGCRLRSFVPKIVAPTANRQTNSGVADSFDFSGIPALLLEWMFAHEKTPNRMNDWALRTPKG